MKKITLLLLGLTFSIVLQGCVTTVRGIFDQDFADQHTASLINPLFPEIQDMHSWMKNDFIKGVRAKINASPKELRADFSDGFASSNESEGVAFVRSGSSGWNHNNASRAAIDRNFEVRDEVFIELCKTYNYTVVRYKYDFSKSLLNKFGLERLTSRERHVNVQWRYTYIGFDVNKEPVIAYIPVMYGVYLQSMGGTGNYDIDSIFLPKSKINQLMNSLSNSFIKDMESAEF